MRNIQTMRLIDANALKRDMGCATAVKYGNKTAEQQHNSYSTLMMYEIANYIDDAPSVEVNGEPVIHSVWLKHESVQKTSWYECANCNTIGSPRWKRCPVCEAKMEVRE